MENCTQNTKKVRWSVIVRNHCTHSAQTSFSLLSYPYLSTTTFGHQIIMFLLLSIKIGEVDFWWCHGWIDSQTSQLSIVCNKIPWNLARIVLEIVPVVYNFRVIDMGWNKRGYSKSEMQDEHEDMHDMWRHEAGKDVVSEPPQSARDSLDWKYK